MRPTYIQENIKPLRAPELCEICNFYYADRAAHVKLNQHKKAVSLKKHERKPATIRYGPFTIRF